MVYLLIALLQYPKTVTLALTLLHFYLRHRLKGRKDGRTGLPFPPGPDGYPIIGNMLDIPSQKAEYAYADLSKQYGDMVYLESMGTKILMLSSVKRTKELFDTRSSIYSSRWTMPMLDAMGFRAYFSLQEYGPAWRRQRQLFHNHFNPTVVDRYHPLIMDETSLFIQDILANPGDFAKRTRSLFTSIILGSMYGIQPKGNDDPFITTPASTMEGFVVASVPGTFLVDLIPALKHVPDWVPGTKWKQIAKYYAGKNIDTRVEPFIHVQGQMKTGCAKPSALLSMLDNLPPVGDPSRDTEIGYAMDTAAVGYLGMVLFIISLLLVSMHPNVQKRAQDELDRVVGFGRLPDFNDRHELVYINALIKEIFRFHQPVPLGIPHATSEDDICDGYFIPKGTVVMGNAWEILHNPEDFPDPFTFNPDRFIKDGKLIKDVGDPTFGFGRRRAY
ncbi:hypothetical protein D9611_013524 [Ephemerocybe angulata]|uniref:Cytochrome P450 n=1 Tax=Ephemerocybe angulata TaxID=980116 RepID=A0A8H5C381_9AGAR|nr:hypothetical protein D9611_013524 [Tulosesus angulatus]